MKTEQSTVYRCDHCGKRFLSRTGCKDHERSCQCWRCKFYTPESKSDGEYEQPQCDADMWPEKAEGWHHGWHWTGPWNRVPTPCAKREERPR